MHLALSTNAVVFLSGLAALAYVYVGYPLALRLLARMGLSRPAIRQSIEPRITLVISAYNERAVIAAKLDNSLALDYPRDRLQILVVSDASDDGTDDVVRQYAAPVGLLRMEGRGGKTIGLNAAVRAATGEIMVFSDANAMYRSDALRMLVRNFADPDVGAVTGESRYEIGEEDASTESEDTYWSYELTIKRLESELGSVVGGDGAILAIRRALYQDLDPGDLSDFVSPMEIVAQGYRNIFEPAAICSEGGAEGYGAEYRRKVRIVNRALRASWKMRALLNPFRRSTYRPALFAWQFMSHKVLRWLVPWMLLVVLVTNLFIADEAAFFQLTLWGQIACYGAAAAGAVLAAAGRSPGRILGVPFYFCLVNWASLVALIQVFAGKRYTTWTSSRPDAVTTHVRGR